MSRAEIVVRYDGPAVVDHKMEIEQVAPAMLALAELVKRANQIAHGERASVKILVRADVEQHCFAFGIEIVQTFFEKAKDLLSDENVETAKKIAEWIGIISGGGGLIAGGLFGCLSF
jgi:hypothetical protein